jgi:teichuronic acid biosynthesis glycosyltransferase TuaC
MADNYRVLYFSSQFPIQSSPNQGIFSLQRVLALTRAGCDVAVVSPFDITPTIIRPNRLFRLIKNQAQQPFETIIHGIPAYYPKWICPPKRIIGWYSSFFMYVQVRTAVKKILKAFHPDVILSSWLPDSLAVSILGNAMNIPVLAIADGTDVNLFPSKYRAWSYARDILNKKISNIIFVSEALRAAGNAYGLNGGINTVLHNAVDVHVFTPGNGIRKDGIFTILGVGRLIPTKGFQVLLQAFADLIKRTNQPARLILVGDGPQHDSLLQQAVDLGIRSYLELPGSMDQKKLVKYYQEADVFCLPSFSEGFPCVVVEAMACGKPVVATRVGGISEVVDAQSGILVAPGDAGALRDALLQANIRAWEGAVIRKKILEGFGWENWVETMIRCMDDATK